MATSAADLETGLADDSPQSGANVNSDDDADSWTADDKYSLLNSPSNFQPQGPRVPPGLRMASLVLARVGGVIQIVCGLGVAVISVSGGLQAAKIYFSLLIAACSFVASGSLQIAQTNTKFNTFVRGLYQIVASLSLAATVAVGLLASILITVIHGYKMDASYSQFVRQSPYIADGQHELTAGPVLFVLSLLEFVVLTAQLCFDTRCVV